MGRRRGLADKEEVQSQVGPTRIHQGLTFGFVGHLPQEKAWGSTSADELRLDLAGVHIGKDPTGPAS